MQKQRSETHENGGGGLQVFLPVITKLNYFGVGGDHPHRIRYRATEIIRYGKEHTAKTPKGPRYVK